MPSVKVGNISIYYEILGHGEPLLFINELLTDISEFKTITNELAKQFKLLVFDSLVLHGRKSIPIFIFRSAILK